MGRTKHRIRKRIAMIIGLVLFLVAAFLITSRINHEVRKEKEQKELEQVGMGEYVPLDDKKIHVSISGKENGENTIVFMHGLGMGDCTVSTRPLWKSLEKKNCIFTMDRYGNGLSDDSRKPQSIDAIIEEYRQVLQKKEIKAPYVLIAHSISGIYATYWAQKYPNEVKAIVYLDTDPAQNYVNYKGEIESELTKARIQNLLAESGLQRFFISKEGLVGKNEKGIFTEEEQHWRLLLMYQNTYSRATLSEFSMVSQNAQKVLEHSVKLEIPQLYISATNISGDYYDTIYKEKLEKRFDGNTNEISSYISEQENKKQEKLDEMRQYGNIVITQLSGPHCIYEYKPQETAGLILDFLNE